MKYLIIALFTLSLAILALTFWSRTPAPPPDWWYRSRVEEIWLGHNDQDTGKPVGPFVFVNCRESDILRVLTDPRVRDLYLQEKTQGPLNWSTQLETVSAPKNAIPPPKEDMRQ
jgi:hypothetical protein